MSTSQATYGQIEQVSEMIRGTYKICRAGGGGCKDWNWKPLLYSIRVCLHLCLWAPSDYGLGGVLSKLQPDNIENIVALSSSCHKSWP